MMSMKTHAWQPSMISPKCSRCGAIQDEARGERPCPVGENFSVTVPMTPALSRMIAERGEAAVMAELKANAERLLNEKLRALTEQQDEA